MLEKVYDFLRKNGTFYIATIDGDKPKLRPFGAVLLFEDKLYFVTSNNKNVYNQLVANPNTQICVCDTNRKWLRLSGLAIFEKDEKIKQKMLDNCPVLLPRYKTADNPEMEIFYLKNVKVEWY